GENFAVMQKVIEVDPDELYPERKLGIPIKGINYHIGRRFIGYYGVPPTELEMEEALTIIRNELGCNAIKIYGDYEDLMITCAKKSFDKNFKTIILSPRYSKKNPSEDMDIEGHIENIIEFSKIAENLRKKSDSIILSVGDELTISVRGITGGLTYEERVKEMKDKWTDITYQNKLNLYLKKIIKGVRENFKGKITYASAGGERFGINWDDLDFDIIGPHYYIAKEWYTKEEMIKTLLSYKKYNKPIYITEFGCSSYEGASRWGGGGFFNYTNQKYSQKEQAQTIEESIKVYEQAHVDGIFLWEFIERFGDDAKSLGIIKYNEDNPMERKLGFYMYKSYQTL
ncbi:MAG: glycosyl hydrolase, partial [Candidatus Aminicenantia bacterium]